MKEVTLMRFIREMEQLTGPMKMKIWKVLLSRPFSKKTLWLKHEPGLRIFGISIAGEKMKVWRIVRG